MQILRSVLSGLAALSFLLIFLIIADFHQRREPRMSGAEATRIAVVFTGQFDRIDTALSLFEEGRIDRLLISGVSPGSGLRTETLADQFNFSTAARAALLADDIHLSPDALDTFQNAAETACWLQTLQAQDGVILVTSVSHMPRASILLERSMLPGTPVYRTSPPSAAGDAPAYRVELGKFIFSWLASLLPASRRPAPHLGLCVGQNPVTP